MAAGRHILKKTPAQLQQDADKAKLATASLGIYNYINPGDNQGFANGTDTTSPQNPSPEILAMRSWPTPSLNAINESLGNLNISNAARLPFYATAIRENAKGDPLHDTGSSRGLMQVQTTTATNLLTAYKTHTPGNGPGLLAILHKYDSDPIPNTPAGRDLMHTTFAGYKQGMGIQDGKPFPSYFHSANNDTAIVANPFQAAIDYIQHPNKKNAAGVRQLLHDPRFNALMGATNQLEQLHNYGTAKFAKGTGVEGAVLADIAYIKPAIAKKIAGAARDGHFNENIATLLESSQYGKPIPAKDVRQYLSRNGTALAGTVGTVLNYHLEKMGAFLPPAELQRQREALEKREAEAQSNNALATAPVARSTASPPVTDVTPPPANSAPKPNTNPAFLRATQAGIGPEAATILTTGNVTHSKGVLGLGLIGAHTDDTINGVKTRLHGPQAQEAALALKEERQANRGNLKGAAKTEARIVAVEKRTGVRLGLPTDAPG